MTNTPEQQQMPLKPCEPCPCCAALPQIHHDYKCFGTAEGWQLRCDNCGLQTCWWHSEEEAYAHWNSRPSSPQSARKRIKEVVFDWAMSLPENVADVLECRALRDLADRLAALSATPSDPRAEPQPRATEPLLSHISIVPFKAICGADEPNQKTTQIAGEVTCKTCEWESTQEGREGFFRCVLAKGHEGTHEYSLTKE